MTKTLEKKAVGKPVKPATKEELEVAAYFHWLNRGCPADDGLTDWIEAEKTMAVACKAMPSGKK